LTDRDRLHANLNRGMSSVPSPNKRVGKPHFLRIGGRPISQLNHFAAAGAFRTPPIGASNPRRQGAHRHNKQCLSRVTSAHADRLSSGWVTSIPRLPVIVDRRKRGAWIGAPLLDSIDINGLAIIFNVKHDALQRVFVNGHSVFLFQSLNLAQ